MVTTSTCNRTQCLSIFAHLPIYVFQGQASYNEHITTGTNLEWLSSVPWCQSRWVGCCLRSLVSLWVVTHSLAVIGMRSINSVSTIYASLHVVRQGWKSSPGGRQGSMYLV